MHPRGEDGRGPRRDDWHMSPVEIRPHLAPATRSTRPRLHEFVATASHELRTPLTALQTTLELLEEEALTGAADTEQIAVHVELALRQTRRLIRLATDLLDVSRLDADVPLARHRVELGGIAQVVAQEFAARLKAGGRRLRVEGPPAVALGDPVAVARILGILLDNAAAYGQGTVTVAVSTDAERVLVAVVDEGPGIAAQERERIFDRFVRGSTAVGAPAGAGLGLSLARGLARSMGGELEAVSVPRGARFVLTLREGDA
jgi:signal transduction histidine kinase